MIPKISIITITYNSEKTLERTIRSVINQNYDNLEYIIVDGSSTDNTCEIISKYKKYVTKMVSEPDKGISDAFNKGIEMSSGDIIGIINSDDGLEKGALTAIAKEYDESVDVYRGNIFFWNEETNSKIREKPSMKLGYSGIGLRLCHQGTFVAKKAYEKYGIFNINYKYNMDFDLLLRFQRAGAVFKYIDYDMAYFTMEGLTFSKYSKKQRIEMETIIKNNGGNFINLLAFRIIKFLKMTVKRVINIDTVLKLKNRTTNRMGK